MVVVTMSALPVGDTVSPVTAVLRGRASRAKALRPALGASDGVAADLVADDAEEMLLLLLERDALLVGGFRVAGGRTGPDVGDLADERRIQVERHHVLSVAQEEDAIAAAGEGRVALGDRWRIGETPGRAGAEVDEVEVPVVRHHSPLAIG
jgi:hypothetical protein